MHVKALFLPHHISWWLLSSYFYAKSKNHSVALDHSNNWSNFTMLSPMVVATTINARRNI